MYIAASNGHTEVMKLLIDSKADFNRPGNLVIRLCACHPLLMCRSVLVSGARIGTVLNRVKPLSVVTHICASIDIYGGGGCCCDTHCIGTV